MSEDKMSELNLPGVTKRTACGDSENCFQFYERYSQICPWIENKRKQTWIIERI